MSSDHATAVAHRAKKDRHIVSWTQEEDDLLREQVAVNGSDNWTIIASQFKDKTGRQCRRRWLTYLSTDCKKGGWSPEEDMLLCEAQKIFGNRWTEIAKVVTGRTDNAVKNRFSTLCKKRTKHHTVSKENNDPCAHPSSKKIMVEPSTNKQQIRSDGSCHTENFSSNASLGATHVIGVQSRPPLTVLTQNFNNLSCFPAQSHLATRDANVKCGVQSTFLRRDDPKLTALLQQAELLSSLAVKAYSENKNHSLEDAWKVLQNFLIRTPGSGTLRNFSDMNCLFNNFKCLFEDFECVDAELQLSWREVELEDSQSSSEMSTGCSHDDQGSNMHKNQPDHCSIDCKEGLSHKHEESPAPVELICQGEEVMPLTLEFAQKNESPQHLSKSEFDSPVNTIPPFHSFTEEIPSPEFSSSEKKFLQSVLGVSSSPKPVSNTKQRDPRPDSGQSNSCKRVLLDSL